MSICLFPGSRVATDLRVVAKQEIQEVESAKRAGSPYAHHRNQAKETNKSETGSDKLRHEFDVRSGLSFCV